MALIKCYECSAEISDKASRCPNCGAPVVVHRWRCSKCGNMISEDPCPYCHNQKLLKNTNDENLKNDKLDHLKVSKRNHKKRWIILVIIALIIICIAALFLKLFMPEKQLDESDQETVSVDMGLIGNKISVDGTVAYVAGNNKILVPYIFCGDYNECQSEVYTKSLKGCENPQLPTDETEALPEEVAREIIAFYGDTGGFWTSLEATHANIEISGYEPESMHYAGIMDNYFSVDEDNVATTVYGYCLSATEDSTIMGLLVLYDVTNEFEFTDIEDTADPNYSTVPTDLYESVMGTNDDNLDDTQQKNSNKNDKDTEFEVNAKILDNSQLTINNGWIYFRGDLGLCRMKTDGSNNQLLSKGNPLTIRVKDDWVYYCDDNQSLYRIKIDGSNKQIIYDGDPGKFVIDQDWIYCSNVLNSEIFRLKTDGSNKQKIIDWNCSEQLAVVDNWLYFGDLYRVKTDGTNLEKLEIPGGVAQDITVIDDWVYYRSDYTINRIRNDGSQGQQLSDDDIYRFAIIDDWIYYSNESDGSKIYRMKIDGTENQMLINEPVSYLWVDGDWIFYTSSVIGDLFRIKIDGSQRQLLCQSY